MRVLLITLTILSACKSTDKVELIHEKEIHQMNRQEVINAIQDCRSANLRSVLTHARIKTMGRSIPIVVDIYCAPF